MTVDARTEEFQHIEVFDKFALFTNARIDRTTVPKGWYCYGFRGTGDDPGELRFMVSKCKTLTELDADLLAKIVDKVIVNRISTQVILKNGQIINSEEVL